MHEYMSGVRIWELTCPGLLEEVGRARRWIRDILSDSAKADDAALIVTELSTNALLHSNSGNEQESFSLTLARAPEWIAISVADSGGTRSKPHIKAPDHSRPQGRGLVLVAALASHLEARGDTDGRIVTVTLFSKEANASDETPTAAVTTTPEGRPC